MTMEQLEEFDDIVKRILARLPPERVAALYPMEQVLASYPPEQRVAGLSSEQRVAGLSAEQQLLALPVEALQALSDAYLDTLSAPTRAVIRARIGR